MSPASPTPAVEGVGKGKFTEVRTQCPLGMITGKRVVPLWGFHPNDSGKAKAPRSANENVRDGRGVGALSLSTPMKSHSPNNGAVSGSLYIGGLELPFGVLIGQDILSRPSL